MTRLYGALCWACVTLGVALLAPPACTNLAYESCQLACGDQASCPSDFVCDAASNRCVRMDEPESCAAEHGCAAGYQASADGTRCEDIDECTQDNGGCMHSCEDGAQPGDAPSCGCHAGFELAADGVTCACPAGLVPDDEGLVCRCGPGTTPLAGLAGDLRLWLDADTLPPSGTPLVEWCDRSGWEHHALPRTRETEPSLLLSQVADGQLGLALDPNEWLEVRAARAERPHQALPLGTRDFYLMILGQFGDPGLPSSVCLFTNAVSSNEVGLVMIRRQMDRDVSLLVPRAGTAGEKELQVSAAAGAAPIDDVTRQYAVWRRGNVLELRVDGAAVGSAALPAGFDLTGVDAPVIGACNSGGSSLRAVLHAAVVIGTPSSADVDAVEGYFRSWLAGTPN